MTTSPKAPFPRKFKARPPRPPRSIKLRKIGISAENPPNMAAVVKGILGAAEATVQRKKAFRDTWHKRLIERRNRLCGWPLPRARPDAQKCSTCKVVKPADAFTASSNKPNLLSNECKACRRARYLRQKERASRERKTLSKP